MSLTIHHGFIREFGLSYMDFPDAILWSFLAILLGVVISFFWFHLGD